MSNSSKICHVFLLFLFDWQEIGAFSPAIIKLSGNEFHQSQSNSTTAFILGFHYTIMPWIWVGINLGCIDAYPVLEWANDMKLHIFTTNHKVNTSYKY